jgi:uncharacterized protein (TIGR02246 family)
MADVIEGTEARGRDVPGDALAKLEARLARAEDLLEIQQLFIDYGHYLDAGDFAAYAALFAADGEILMGPMGRARGPVEIEALMTRALASSVGATFHLITSPRVALAGDRATSEVMWTVVQRDQDGKPEVPMVGRHKDELVREDGRWRFKRRQGYIDIPSKMPPRT